MTLSQVDRYTRNAAPPIGNRAVVLGGGMAGLCTARVLADAFDDVVIIDRDPLPERIVARDGVPQASHPHVLLEAGRQTLEDLFPGFSEAVLSAGGLMIDAATDVHYFEQGDYLADCPNRLPMYCASRPLFEAVVRHLIRQRDNIQIRDRCQFITYCLDDTGTAVTGVRIRDKTANTNQEIDLSADLIVDATGRTSRTPVWLENHGYTAPPIDEVTINVTYSTIRIERPPDARIAVLAPPNPPRTRGGAAVPIENNQWELILGGIHGDDSPTQPGRFIDFSESLPLDVLATLAKEQSWKSDDIHYYPFPSSRWHHYEHLDRFPDGLLVTGDAIASFNPVYGQGMSVAALDALILHHTLATNGLENLAPRFFDRAATVVDEVWKIAVGADFEFPQTTGPKPPGTDLFNRYLSRLKRQAHDDGVLTEAFFRVFRLEQPATTLVRPNIMWRVLRPNQTDILSPSQRPLIHR